MYQGLGLLCFPLVALAKKISFLQENWGSSDITQSDALSLAYDDFLMEVGFYRNPFSWDYTNYGQLAMPTTWFSNLWQLCHTFMVTVRINEGGRQITPIHENDKSIMSDFFVLDSVGINWWHLIQFGSISTSFMYLTWCCAMDGQLTPFLCWMSR
jgi:hypothetical protein